MKKNILSLTTLAFLLPMIAFAQAPAPSLDEEVNSEIDKMVEKSAPEKKSEVKVIRPQMMAAPTIQIITAPMQPMPAPQAPAAVTAQPVEVPNISKQPTTVVESTPLVESKADQLRKSRQEAEVATETGIVEKLEQSRLEDEKKRAEVLFGDKFNNLMKQGTQPTAEAVSAPVAPVVAPIAAPVVPVVAVEPVAAPKVEETVVKSGPSAEELALAAEKKAELDREMVRGEINTAIAELKKVEEEKPVRKSYAALLVGATDYPDAENVKPQYSLGVAIGKQMNDRFVLEGSFQYSNFQVEQRFLTGTYFSGSCYYDFAGNCYPRITEMNQYTTSAVLKYQLFSGMIKPEIGGLFSYTYRSFSDKQFAISSGTVSSQALDMGVVGGIGIELSENTTVGIDAKYSWNLTNKVDGTALQKSSIYQGYSTDKAIEDLSYWSTNLSLKATF
jgi:hypothetical protein